MVHLRTTADSWLVQATPPGNATPSSFVRSIRISDFFVFAVIILENAYTSYVGTHS